MNNRDDAARNGKSQQQAEPKTELEKYLIPELAAITLSFFNAKELAQLTKDDPAYNTLIENHKNIFDTNLKEEIQKIRKNNSWSARLFAPTFTLNIGSVSITLNNPLAIQTEEYNGFNGFT